MPAMPRAILLTGDPAWVRVATRELAWTGEARQGLRGPVARRVNEWLWLSGNLRTVSNVYGATTTRGVSQFQQVNHLPVTGVVDAATFAALSAPMAAAGARLVIPAGTPLGAAALIAARQHIAARPREVGGPNAGPWVRSYMGGLEGAQWAWCAGFVGAVVRQAALATGKTMPFEWDRGVPSIGRHAADTRRMVRG